VPALLGSQAGLIGAASLILWEGESGAPLAMALDKDRASERAATRPASQG